MVSAPGTQSALLPKSMPADYAGAIAQGHEVIAAIFEVTGGAHHEIVEFLNRLAKAHANKLPLDLAGRSWTATTFKRYFSQRMSMAIHKAAARELKRGIRHAKFAPPGSAHLRGRKGPAPMQQAAVRMSVVGVVGL